MYSNKMYSKKMYGKNRSVISSKNNSATLYVPKPSWKISLNRNSDF